ncbi:MAG: TraB/GumN family protein [Bacteroidota bacterium]
MRGFFIAFIFLTVTVHAETLPTSGTLLWRISGNGLKTSSYLYGTMHTRDKRVFHFSDSVLTCFMRCKSFAMELKLDDINREEVISNMMMDSGQTIENFLTKTQYDSLQQKMQQSTGLPLSLFDRLKPIYIATMLSQGELLGDSSDKNSNQLFLDEYFEQLANQSGKKVHALELLQTQLNVFNYLSLTEQIIFLMKSIRDESPEKGIDTFINHYVNGELEVLVNSEDNNLWPADFVGKILYERNKGMADHVEALIKEQSTFAAFGAAHLTGDSGVISLLRKKGFTVEPVQANYNDISDEGWLYIYPCSVIAVPMPGIPVLATDTLAESKCVYQKWISNQSNNYCVAHFNKNISINKSLLQQYVKNETGINLKLERAKNEFVSRRNIKTYKLNDKSSSGNLFVIENGNEKIEVIVLKNSSVDIDELKRFLSIIRYKVSSVINY